MTFEFVIQPVHFVSRPGQAAFRMWETKLVGYLVIDVPLLNTRWRLSGQKSVVDLTREMYFRVGLWTLLSSFVSGILSISKETYNDPDVGMMWE